MKPDKEDSIVTQPGNLLGSAGMRIQEHIFGHRFTVDQDPYMILLEALAVCSEIPLGSKKVVKNRHEDLKYGLKFKKEMRFLIFHDQRLGQITNDDQIPDNEKWEKWKSEVDNQYDFDYLDTEFNRNIDALNQAVCILRSQEIDVSNNRRSTSKFMAVRGPDTILGDFKGDWSRDRLFFARGGELVYLMLNRNRSVPVEELNQMIEKRFLDSDNPINKIARKISANDESSEKKKIGYLPIAHHKIYDQMANDWISILNTPYLPDSHVFDPLFRITGLNLMAYFAARAEETMGQNLPTPVVVDLTSGTDSHLKDYAKADLSYQRTLTDRAVSTYIREIIWNTDEWKTAVRHGNADKGRQIIGETFMKSKYINDNSDLEQLLLSFIKTATSRPKYNLHATLLPLTKGIGIVESRGPTRTWFSLSDELIDALVIANVATSSSIELRDFTRCLYDKYRLVIGPEEAREAFKENPPLGMQSFQGNLAALERRMTQLSLTIRHSDDCAFVVNPYRGKESV